MPLVPQLNAQTVEHGSTRLSRWLQDRWLSLAAAIAVGEGIFVLLGAFSKWAALIVAVVILGLYFGVNRRSFSPSLRIGSRAVALSQGLVLFIPILFAFVSAVAIFAVVVIGIFGIATLLRRR